VRDRTEADDIVQGAYNRALLDLILPAMRRAAKDHGYALTVHGSLNRDIDIVAIPWIEHARDDADDLVKSICGAARGVTGRCNFMKDWEAKPHGRRAKAILVWCGETTANIDLSVMPAISKGD
jgi:hypothetical protein